jgi:hypothetical protein
MFPAISAQDMRIFKRHDQPACTKIIVYSILQKTQWFASEDRSDGFTSVALSIRASCSAALSPFPMKIESTLTISPPDILSSQKTAGDCLRVSI